MTGTVTGSRYVGVKGWAHGDITTELKRALLFFDQVIVGHVHEPSYCRQFEELSADLAVLDDRGIIIRGPYADFDARTYLWLHEDEDDLRNPTARVTSRLPSGRPTIFETGGPTVPRLPRATLADMYARKFATLRSHAETRIPLLSRFANVPLADSSEASVLQVVFHRIPMPTKTTPWKAIMEWRDDSDARAKFVRLRRWIHDIDKSEPTHVIADRLEAALSDYCDYMRVQHATFAPGKWEALIQAFVEILETLPQLKLSPLLNAAFSARRNRLQLTAAEQKAPHRDVAYILATRNAFRNPAG